MYIHVYLCMCKKYKKSTKRYKRQPSNSSIDFGSVGPSSFKLFTAMNSEKLDH